MPVKRTAGSHVNTASSHLDLFAQLVAFLTTANEVTEPEAHVDNDGDGEMSQPTADNDAPTETWTVEYLGSDLWSVEGSESGPRPDAETGEPYDSIVQFEIVAGAIPFEVGDSFSFDVAQVMGGAVWEELKNTTGGGSGDFSSDGEVYLRAFGPSGEDEIFVNLRSYSSVPSDRYNIEIQGATAFDDELAFDEQPGSIPAAQGVPQILLWSNPISFVLVANARRFVLVCFAAGQPTQSAFAGWFNAFGPPSLYPAPLFVGGSHWDTTKNAATSTGDTEHVFFADNFSDASAAKSQAHCRTPGGGWARLRQGRSNTSFDDNEARSYVHPNCFLPTAARVIHGYGAGGTASYLLVQATLHLHAQVFENGGRIGDCAMVGELPGLFWTSGFGVTTGDIMEVGGDDYFAFNDTRRTGLNNYLALKLE